MAIDFPHTNANGYRYRTPTVSADYPVTACAWVKPSALSSWQFIWNMNKGTKDNQLALATFNDRLTLYVRASGTTYFQNKSASAITTGSWYHACSVWRSATDRELFVNGVSAVTDTASAAFAAGSWYEEHIGDWGQYDLPWDGEIAEQATWDVGLSDGEIAALAAGASPASIRPDSLHGYRPLFRGSQDVINDIFFSSTGTLTAVDHPPVYRPSASILQFPAPAVGGGGAVPQVYHHRRLIGAN